MFGKMTAKFGSHWAGHLFLNNSCAVYYEEDCLIKLFQNYRFCTLYLHKQLFLATDHITIAGLSIASFKCGFLGFLLTLA